MDLFEWNDDEGDAVHCRCFCHGTVEVNDAGDWRSYINSPPRLDNDRGWAESCKKCELEHWIAADVHAHLVSMEADFVDDANCYVLKIKREK